MGLVQISSASCLIGTSKSFKTKTKPNQNKTKQRMSHSDNQQSPYHSTGHSLEHNNPTTTTTAAATVSTYSGRNNLKLTTHPSTSLANDLPQTNSILPNNLPPPLSNRSPACPNELREHSQTAIPHSKLIMA
ncbi:hypothetical protein PGT21_002104 [Puccinia graminis f. sp. tritici]|uniref:Uncharacterized protein n=1 Tax=Puccinia graminis f. sp. tritici TaxID=56615 RepID=A0A5B0LN94_PUCGR|nr:hypothetical protein PGT21_002104 [Puccinia graminis f. sp. tritici]